MAREIPRTVLSFLPPYQQGVDDGDVEIIVMENGSSIPVPMTERKMWPQTVRYVTVSNPKGSPASALNAGVAMAKGDWVCPVIDGARLVSPGLLGQAMKFTQLYENPVIATLGYHLGDKPQQKNVAFGYNQAVEDELLADIGWPDNAYKLFDVSALGTSARGAWLAPIAESNVLIMRKRFYQQIGGYDEAFDIPGGGLVNLDFFRRAITHKDSVYGLLIDEASFHQYHGGVTTSRPVKTPDPGDPSRTTWEIYAAQYEAIRGEPFSVVKTSPILFGRRLPHVEKTAQKAAAFLMKDR